MYAPIVLFVFNRLDNVKKTFESLAQNTYAKDSELYIFSDGPRNSKDESSINQVREYINQQINSNLFKKVVLFESEKNKGLANSIISGVSTIMRMYGKAIVIEDDCISSPDFLEFMNKCLDYYKNNEKVWSIAGYSLNLDFPTNYVYDVYCMGRTCSYAWGTWSDRWDRVDWEVKDYNIFRKSLKKRKLFNLYGEDRSKMLDYQQLGKTNSWAIRFCYSMFKNSMYTIYPIKSKIKNVGYDNGTHKMNRGKQFTVEPQTFDLNRYLDEIEINEKIRRQFVSFYKTNKLKLFVSFFVNVLFKKNRSKI